MEIGLDGSMPTYSGGLGVLAGDTIKSAADLAVPMVAVSLVHEKGYFSQKLGEDGWQEEIPSSWRMEEFLEPLDVQVIINIEGREVRIKPWRKIIRGVKGYEVPIIFLDTNIPGNSDYDKSLTSFLYGGDQKYRFAQEMVLGIGGLRMLNALGYSGIKKYHMNEGHASLLTLELYKETDSASLEDVRHRCVFTTHTPVPAGHDRFDVSLVKELMPSFPFEIRELLDSENKVNMTLIGLYFSNYVNGVAKKHGEVSQEMFPNYPIHSITNGVHSATWTSPEMQELFDRFIPEWRLDPFTLRYAAGIPDEEILKVHGENKRILIDEINARHNTNLEYDLFTVGFARRATSYKRPDLLFFDIERLKRIVDEHGVIQLVFAGKAHKKDVAGKELIKKLFSISKEIGDKIRMIYLDDYDITLAKVLIPGVDVWLNTPMRPKEASGTSGMKAAHNGVPSLSILDGWWLEGCIEGVTGWSVGDKTPVVDEHAQNVKDANSLYDKLEKIVPLYYVDKHAWAEIMKYTIVINASFFNTHRMVSQYVLKAYFH
ncbi:alpha-glucan family phosphorylase [Candidatus Woesearchaeota archaeon]|nr:alpha-glucan family phosphorylase [Candidatus Woesearchaeota archaeon]